MTAGKKPAPMSLGSGAQEKAREEHRQEMLERGRAELAAVAACGPSPRPDALRFWERNDAVRTGARVGGVYYDRDDLPTRGELRDL